LLRRPDWRPQPGHHLPRSVWLLYAVGLVNIGLIFGFYGWEAGLWASIAAMMFWAAALMHERYTYR
jgi:hypothetical protein